jgi:hypothetical protein
MSTARFLPPDIGHRGEPRPLHRWRLTYQDGCTLEVYAESPGAALEVARESLHGREIPSTIYRSIAILGREDA